MATSGCGRTVRPAGKLPHLVSAPLALSGFFFALILAAPCRACDAPLVEAAGSRYLAITPAPCAHPVSIVVTYVGGGTDRYVGSPGGQLNIAYLEEDPGQAAWLIPGDWGTVYVTDLTLAGGSGYDVVAVHDDGGGPVASPVSTTVTPIFGDVDANGTVDFRDINDAVAVYNGNPTTATVYAADVVGALEPCEPDGEVTMLDIDALVATFQGYPPCVPDCDLLPQGFLVQAVGELYFNPEVGLIVMQPGETITLEVWIRDYGDQISGIELQGSASPRRTAEGTLTVSELTANLLHPDFLFAGCGPVVTGSNLPEFRFFALPVNANPPCPQTEPRQIATFEVTASPDAQGRFVVKVDADPNDDSVIGVLMLPEGILGAPTPARVTIMVQGAW